MVLVKSSPTLGGWFSVLHIIELAATQHRDVQYLTINTFKKEADGHTALNRAGEQCWAKSYCWNEKV